MSDNNENQKLNQGAWQETQNKLNQALELLEKYHQLLDKTMIVIEKLSFKSTNNQTTIASQSNVINQTAIKRIYIRGCPRSGNTLMLYLCSIGFQNSYILTNQDIPILAKSHPDKITFGTLPNPQSSPEKEEQANNFLNQSDAAIIFMVRDPRDVLVSENGQKPGEPWVKNPQKWINNALILEKLQSHPRVVIVKYEDLVSKPNKVQKEISEKLGLIIATPFRQVWQYAQPTSGAIQSLNGWRQLETSRIANWQGSLEKKNYVEMQLKKYPKIFNLMNRLGYKCARFISNSTVTQTTNKRQDYELQQIINYDQPPKEIVVSTDNWVREYRQIMHTTEAESKKVYDYQTLPFIKPKTIETRLHENFFHPQLKNQSSFVFLIPKGRVVGIKGAIITPDNQLALDISRENGININNAHRHSIMRMPKLPPIIDVKGSVVNLSLFASTGNYFHWTINLLPRIDILKKGGLDIHQIDKFVINQCKYPAQMDAIKILGIPEEKVIFSHHDLHLRAEKLIVPSISRTSIYSINFLRQEFLLQDRYNDYKLLDTPKKIYIARGNTNRRSVINESEVITVLSQKGFHSLDLTNFSLLEQVSLFARAEIIIAPHGAGLTNMVFCNSNTKLIEIFSPHYVNKCFWEISCILGIDYYYILGEKTISKYKQKAIYADENIFIDIDKLTSTLQLSQCS
jgi:capsular polysaccharide biosynthesis protein